ncbi:MAG: hypothetical protein H8K09_07030 [Nitrospira sp.]|nr:hypothetical protein [Nitrospira sp.]MCS6320142.1 hypothetical protein [Nitrospira sp.]
MHDDFAEWYRVANIPPNADILPKRWKAIEAYSPDRDGVISLTRLFYRLGKPNESFLSGFVKPFQDSDPLFHIRNNEYELSLLAGAELVDVMERSNSKLKDLAALSLVSAAAENLRSSPCVPDIPEIAADHLGQRSSDRIRLDEDELGEEIPGEMFKELLSLGKPYENLVFELRRMQKQIAVVTEESNMLWWLFSEFSRDLRQRWDKYTAAVIAIVAGKELADLTREIPGPVAAAAFLDRIIRCAKGSLPASVSLKDAINTTPREWREKFAETNCPSELQDLLPIGKGVKLSLESSGKTSWLPFYEEGTGISSSASIAPHLLAHQVFREAILCRSWKECK